MRELIEPLEQEQLAVEVVSSMLGEGLWERASRGDLTALNRDALLLEELAPALFGGRA
jgi:hypothetical protein